MNKVVTFQKSLRLRLKQVLIQRLLTVLCLLSVSSVSFGIEVMKISQKKNTAYVWLTPDEAARLEGQSKVHITTSQGEVIEGTLVETNPWFHRHAARITMEPKGLSTLALARKARLSLSVPR